MADHYPAILRAVAALETNTFEGRRAIYNYARAALVEQLDKRPFIKKGVDRERLMLEEAISRTETETANKQTIIARPSAAAVPPENKSFFARFYGALRRAGPSRSTQPQSASNPLIVIL
jgi:hypothetical protein